MLAIALAGCAGSSAAPERKAAAPNVFASKRYGYRVAVPAGWFTPDRFAEDTKGDWDGVLYPLEPGVDTFADAGGQPRLSVAARRVPPGTGLQQWAAHIARGVPTPCGRPETRAGALVGAEHAVVQSYHCTDGCYVITATVLHKGRGFALGWASPEGSEKKDRAAFERVLGSLTFAD